MRILFYFLFIIVFLSCKNENQQTSSAVTEQQIDTVPPVIEVIQKDTFPTPNGWMKFENSPKVQLDVRYATENNFVEEVLYPCERCYLNEQAGEKLLIVIDELYQKGFKTVLFDCYRPKPIQQKLWDKVPNPSYVTPPHRGSMHNRGLAVDIGLADPYGNLINMGSEYDYFGKEAHHDYLDIDKEIYQKRQLLKRILEKHGFAGIRTEWWHYSYVGTQSPLSEWVWKCD